MLTVLKTHKLPIATAGVGAVTAGLYWLGRNIMIQQQPYEPTIIVSNLTMNMVALFMLAGGFSPYITKRLVKRYKPKWEKNVKTLSFATTAILILLVMQILKIFGVDVRF